MSQTLPIMTKDKLGWLIMFLMSKPHGVLFSEIQEQWKKNLPEDKRNKELQYRTFHNWCKYLEEGGQFYIETNKKTNTYHLRKREYAEDSSLAIDIINYSLVDYGKICRAMDNQMIQDRIVKEPQIDSEENLDLITTAMRENKVLLICYEKFGEEEAYEVEVHPYALRLCQLRWYMLAYCPDRKGLRTYAIDRLPCCTILKKKFKIQKDFDAEEYYKDCIGVFKGIKEEEKTPAYTVLKVTKYQSEYLQTLPLHQSQTIIAEDHDHTVFAYNLLPTDELALRILAMGDQVEVVAPQLLRDKIKQKIALMQKIYE
ncbi:MAG: WYL domain-containing protein [Bacteroidaceae bacterium]|nr:WYL domain-containing protein [Bacteroidaceae bacterium]